ncbi:MAG: hypothetical protein ACYC56_07595 [Candidatus Aquicultor sp.]
MRVVSKSVLLVAAIFSFIVATASTALAIEPTTTVAGYNWPQIYDSTTNTPHGGYTTTTNKCQECHAVHLATGSYMLTRANKRAETCDFCHNYGGPGVGTDVMMNAEGHGLDATQTASTTITAPDDTIPSYQVQTAKWGCLECHSVHDNQTVKLTGETSTYLLKSNPNPGKTYLFYTVTTGESSETMSEWCSTCHNADFGRHDDTQTVKNVMLGTTTTTVYGHDCSGGGYSTDSVTGYAVVTETDTSNEGPTCKQCHVATGTGGNFPHSSENTSQAGDTQTVAPDMLMAGTIANQLDKVCETCHNTASLQ